MGEFGSNNDDNERKEKTSERAREREGGGERGRAPGSRKRKERKRKELFFFERGLFPPHRPSFPSLPFLLSERKYVKNTCKKLRERLFLNPEPGGGLRTKRQERERTAEVEVFSARAVVAIAVVANDSTPMAFSFFFSPFFAS